MTTFSVIFVAYALLVVAIVAWLAWIVWLAPHRERKQIGELEAAWALTTEEHR